MKIFILWLPAHLHWTACNDNNKTQHILNTEPAQTYATSIFLLSASPFAISSYPYASGFHQHISLVQTQAASSTKNDYWCSKILNMNLQIQISLQSTTLLKDPFGYSEDSAHAFKKIFILLLFQ